MRLDNRIFIFCVFMSLLAISCNRKEEVVTNEESELTLQLDIPNNITPLTGSALSKSEINELVQSSLNKGEIFKWSSVDDRTRWSAAILTDSIVSIGYKPIGFGSVEGVLHEVDVESGQWQSVYNALTEFILLESRKYMSNPDLQLEDVLAFGKKELPYFSVKMYDYELMAKLSQIDAVRYIEPMGFGTEVQNRDFGCGGNNGANPPSSDFSVVAPYARVSWNYEHMNIPGAWESSEGDNITVGLIDTGISPNQNKLNSQFASDWSTGRYREAHGTYEECWWWWCWNDGPDDDCGHGTSMAGVIAAPRTDNGSSTGVAYKSNLISVRGTDDVVINSSSEKDGVSDAYYYLGNRNDVKIISASLGDVFYSGQVADAVQYAYNKGKLILAAAGTSTSWTNWYGVIFPATMNQTTAVTGITDDPHMERCDNCHSGSHVDFVAVMQRDSYDERTSLTLAQSGNNPSYVGGSSVATATTAGIAALIWAKDPAMNRNEVLEIMKQSSSNYPSKDNHFGWGLLNAEAAVNSVQ